MLTVAAVIACRDDGRTLEQAVVSARAQGPRLSELVVIDDGSTDVYTRQVLSQLQASGTHVIRTAPEGVAAARNLGVQQTAAPCVLFLDADDALVPGYFDDACRQLESDPDLAFVSCAMEDHRGGPAWRPSTDLVDGLVRAHIHVSTVIRRRAFAAVGGFDPRLPGLEDAALFAALAAGGARGLVLESAYLRYRVRRGSRTDAALETSAYQASMAAIVERNRDALAKRWRELLLTCADHIVEQRVHARTIHNRLGRLQAQTCERRAAIEVARERLERAGRPAVAWGDFARTAPFSDRWGLERGQPIDRVYVEAFLERYASDIQGHVLEVKDAGYTRYYGGGRVTAVSVLDVDATNPAASIVGDLTVPDTLGDSQFDCVVLTQVLNVIADARAALANAIASLKPGGVLLCTVSALNRVSCEPGGADGDYWRFTEAALRYMCADLLPPENFEVASHGNVKSCTAFLYGLASHEIAPEDLAVTDPAFPLIVTLRAVKPSHTARRASRPAVGRGLVLTYHRIAEFSPDPHNLCLRPERFEAHLRWLVSGYDVLPLDELSRRALSGSLTRDAVAVTLDDGYVDHLTAATPLAHAAGVPLTCFVTSGGLDEDREFWWDALEHLLLEGDRPDTLELSVGGSRLSWETKTPLGRWTAHEALVRRFYVMDAADRTRSFEDLARWAGADLPARAARRMLRRSELSALARQPGVTIGSHTVEHLDLLAMRRETVVRELVESRIALESALRTPVRLLSYPYGNADEGIADLAAAAGFSLAFTVDARAIRAADRTHMLPRLSVGNWQESELANRVSRALHATASEPQARLPSASR